MEMVVVCNDDDDGVYACKKPATSPRGGANQPATTSHNPIRVRHCARHGIGNLEIHGDSRNKRRLLLCVLASNSQHIFVNHGPRVFVLLAQETVSKLAQMRVFEVEKAKR
jgi:hypothetical protein